MKVFYDFPAIKSLVLYILVPILVILIFCGIGLLIYSMKKKNHKDKKYNYNMNLYSSLVCTLICAILFSISFAFGISFISKMKFYNLTVTYRLLYYFYLLFPLIPFGITIFFGIKVVRTYRRKNELMEEDTEEVKHMIDDDSMDVIETL